MKQELIAGLILGALGLGLFFTPKDKLWAITEKWKTQDGGQPAKGYGVLMRILGIVFAGTGVIVAVIGLTK